MENELMIQEHSDLTMVRSPLAVLSEAREAAQALKDVISKKEKPVKIKGEQYLEFEDWQTIARFYGVVVGCGEAEPVEIDGVKGAKAVSQITHLPSGRVAKGAVAYCMRDEDQWQEKPWFQLASMAQTRACSKGLRNAFSWVVVMAGYKPTPAEEMAGMDKVDPRGSQTPPKQDSKPVDAVKVNNDVNEAWASQQITEKQAKRLYAIAKSVGWTAKDIELFLTKRTGQPNIEMLRTGDYQKICSDIEKGLTD